MIYQLSKTESAQLIALKEQLFLYYNEDDAKKLYVIIDRALCNGWIDKDDIYKLIEVLPRIIPLPKEHSSQKADAQNTDWNEYIDEHRVKYKREMERLYHILSNWVFMQNAIYQKNSDPIEESAADGFSNTIHHGIKNNV